MNQNPTSIASYPTVKTIVLVAHRDEQKRRWQEELGTLQFVPDEYQGNDEPHA